MIVICTNCQAKFRVADEKIGPRGAKVRCSRCRTVFLVQPDLGALPVEAPSAPTENPFVANPIRAPAAAAAACSPAGSPAVPALGAPPPLPADPFAALGLGTPLGVAPAGVDADPFAQPAPAADPFAAPLAPADPFAAMRPESPTTSGHGVALTDLSDLLGAATPIEVPRPSASPPPLPPPLPAPEEPPPAAAAPVEPESPDPFAVAQEESGSIALEARTPEPVRAAYGSATAQGDPFAAGFGEASGEPQPFDPGGFELADPSGEGIDLATDVAAAPAPEPSATEPVPSAVEAEPAPEVAAAPAVAPAPATRPAAPAAQGEERIPGRASRLRTVGVNAVALAALILVALAILVVWRRGGTLEAGALRPSALLGALRDGPAASGPFVATEIRSGIYERESGPPVLFVRGKVLSRAQGPVARLRVAVEILRGGEVVARGDALAGAVPTAEELHGAVEPGALEALARTSARRAPAQIRPGQAVPFLVAIAEHPGDVDGATIRVVAAPPGGAAP